MKLTLTVNGATAVQQAILELAKRIPHRIAAALVQEAELTMTEAKELTPVMTGALRASGHVQAPVIEGQEISVTMGFGGAASAYALAVHENPRAGQTGGWGPNGPQPIAFRWIKGRVVPIGAQRKRYSRVGQWKYLEQPFLARRSGFEERVRARALETS